MRTKGYILGIVMILFLTVVSTENAGAEVTSETTVKLEILAGDEDYFDIIVPPVKEAEKVEVTNTLTRFSLGFEKELELTDLRGLNFGWDLLVKAEPLADGDKILPKGTISLYPATELRAEGHVDKLPKIEMENKTIIDDGDILVARADEGTGMGKYYVEFDEDALEVNIDTKEIQSGTYETDLEWSYLSKGEDRRVIKREKLRVTIDATGVEVETEDEDDLKEDEVIEDSGEEDGEELEGNGEEDIDGEETSKDTDEEDKDTESGLEEEGSGEGDGLPVPDTATNMFNMMILGLLFLVVGVVDVIYNKRGLRIIKGRE